MGSRIVASETIESVQQPEATLQANNLRYEINGKMILADVNASFEPKKVTAIMGGSGAGKTTLLNVLAARAPGFVSGEILVNGIPTSLARMRLSLSYMPQDDIMYPQFTVYQLLMYSALLLCPENWTYEAKEKRTREIMGQLGLAHVAQNVISGISGGQRKRTSAAIEFMSARPLLFMDEPTSGLDSAISKALVDSLRVAAENEGRTVIATIHQPSWTLVNKFDCILVLAPRTNNLGGTVVYNGAPSSLPAYFAQAGRPVPNDTNPADHLLYILTDDGGDSWAERWSNSAQAVTKAAEFKAIKAQQADAIYESPPEIAGFDGSDPDFEGSPDIFQAQPYPISYLYMYRVMTQRALHLWVIDSQQGALVFKLQLILYILVASVIIDMPFNLSKALVTFYFFATQFQTVMTPMTVIMPEERSVNLREYRNGVFTAPIYFLSRLTLAIINAALLALITTFCFYPIVGFPVTPFPGKFIKWWSFQFLFLTSILMFGYAIGMAAPSAIAANKAIGAIAIPWLLTAGVFPPNADLRPTTSWLHYPNLFSWASKIGLTIAFKGKNQKSIAVLRDDLKFHLGNLDAYFMALTICLSVILLLGLLITFKVLARGDRSAGERGPPKGAEIQIAEPVSHIKFNHEEEGSHSPSSATKQDAQGLLNPLLGKSSSTNGGGGGGGNYGALHDTEAPEIENHSIPIELCNVTYRYPNKPDKIVMQNINVRFDAGTVSMLAGPSGSGKSTLLNLLSGRLPTGEVVLQDGTKVQSTIGEIFVDSLPTTLAAFKKIGTLTPQDEHLPELLTVRQALMYTAELRSPRKWSYGQKQARVESIMENFNLKTKADTVIGNSLKVGISGGQKKRVSICMDLLAELPIMLLDEPTTGLDASAALNVVETMIALAQDQERTVIVTLHQPPWSTVSSFDKLVLLARGYLIYDDIPQNLPSFLIKGGSPAPENENPADHIMEVLLGDDIGSWLSLNDKNEKKKNTSNNPEQGTVTRRPSLTLDQRAELLENQQGDDAVDLESYLHQVSVLTRRSWYIFCVDEDQLPEMLIPAIITAFMVGFSFRNWGFNVYFGGAIMLIVGSVGMLTISGLALTIPVELKLVLREYRNGTYCMAAYWTARTIIGFAAAFIVTIPLFTITWGLIGLQAEFYPWFYSWSAAYLTGCIFSVFGNIIGIVYETPVAAAQVAEPISILSLIFAGALVTRHFIKDYLLPLYYSLPLGYSFEIVMTSILEHKGDDAKEILQYYDLHAHFRERDFLVLIVMLVVTIAAGYKAALKGIAVKNFPS